MADFPSTLPRPLDTGNAHRPKFDNIVKSDMEIGSRTRMLCTHVPELCTFNLHVSSSQQKILKDFYRTVKNQPFNWIEFRDLLGSSAVYKFTAEPSFQYREGGWDAYIATLELELVSSVWAYGF